ncbi:MAG: hypothetical protein CO117_07810 [Flavobacteriaceae bacterium CG_4_9_14_3_um_filter_33_16]|nr:MAG: hypothetical protein CO117_07810 [Flavobacteriaceae bacterium CG_4_9_14_3_um_filter_33_16]
MIKVIYIFLFLALAGCANIGFDGVEIFPEDTWITILLPINILIILYLVKKEIDFMYFKRERRYDKEESK